MRACFTILLVLVAGPAAGDEIYRTVDAQGNVVYSDRPLGETSELVAVTSGTPRPAPRAADTGVAAPPSPQTAEASEEPSEETIAQATAAQRAEERVRNCDIARDRQLRYSQAHRLFRETEDGEREYLDSEEIDATLAETEALIAEWCD